MNEVSKTKHSFFNAVFAILLTLTNGTLGIVVTRLIIGVYGSDFNGLNSTANQIINVLLVLEGGFTLASNIALFVPISRNDLDTANAILSATRIKFKKIGLVFLLIGIIVAGGYSFTVKTNLTKEFVFTVILMTVIPQAVNLYFTTTYRVLLQTQQKEFVISGFTALTIGLGHITNIVIVLCECPMWAIRMTTMCFSIFNSLLITAYAKKKNKFIDFSKAARPELIKGTNEVFVQKLTGIIYTSWPIVFLSVLSSGGTILASVYAVYNNIFIMLKSLLRGVIDAPRHSFGQMLTEKKKEEIWTVFKQYEMICILLTFIMLVTASGLILPFVSIYTKGIDDMNYYDFKISVLMVLIGVVEMLHIPSGHLINMSGNFRIGRNFQIMACVCLIISMSILGASFGIYGMLASLLIVAIFLAIMEIGFVHIKFFENKCSEYIKLLLPFLIVGTICAIVEMKMTMSVGSIYAFVFFSIVYVIINLVVVIIVCYIFNRKDTEILLKRILLIFSRKRSLK